MSTLTGTKIKDTYPSLLKFSNNGSLDPYFLNIVSDGLGNNTPLLLSGAEFGTQIPATSVPYGFWAQLFSNGNVSIGDYSNQFNGTWIGMNDFSEQIATYSNNLAKGLKIDFPSKSYSFGDFNSIDNGSRIVIDDANENIKIDANVNINLTSNNASILIDGNNNNTNITTDTIQFTGAGLENPTPPANPNPVTYLVVTVNGLQYKIGLLNP